MHILIFYQQNLSAGFGLLEGVSICSKMIPFSTDIKLISHNDQFVIPGIVF